MEIPGVGQVRGIFEILVPGAFLVINLAWLAYLDPYCDQKTLILLRYLARNPGVAAVAGVVFGYLLGTALRMLRTRWADQCSAWWIGFSLFHRRPPIFALGRFPYFTAFRRRCQRSLPRRVVGFYDQIWAPPPRKRLTLLTFDYCKFMVAATDEKAAAEIAAAEALSRFVSGMFYALVVVVTVLAYTEVLLWSKYGYLHRGLTMLGALYLGVLWVILSNFRYLRAYEVEKVFTFAYKNRGIF